MRSAAHALDLLTNTLGLHRLFAAHQVDVHIEGGDSLVTLLNDPAAAWDKPCPPAAYSGLADLYLSHPDFVKRYETIAPGFAEFLVAAMKAHAAKG